MRNIGKKLVAVMLIFMMFFGITEPFAAYEKGETVKVGIYDVEGFYSMDEDGNVAGFGVDYLQMLASITRWEYEFVKVDDFVDGMEALEAHEIDLLAPAMMTDERRAKFVYSELNFGMEYSVLLTTQNREDLFYQDYENYNGLKVAVLEGYPMTEYYIAKMQSHDFDTELIYVATQEEAEALLKSGEVDAMISSVFFYNDVYKVLDMFYPQPFYFMTYKENVEFLGELNTAMNRIQENYPILLEELLYEYYPVYKEEFYTREEAKYIERGKVLRVGYVADREPLSFTDENGELAGISREIFDKISEMSGLKFEYVEIPKGKVTYDILQALEVDLITGVEYNNVNMSSNGVFMSRPYISGQKVLVSKSRSVYSEKKKYKLALVEGSKTFRDVVTANYPNMEIVEYTTVNDCFRALYNEEVDLLMQNQYVVETLMGKPIYSTFSVLPVDGIDDELCFSTITQLNGGYGLEKKECAIVISIINKSISQISDIEMDNIVMRSMVENQYEMKLEDFLYSYRLSIAIISCALTVLLILYVLHRREKKRIRAIKEKEIRLKELQQKRYQMIIDYSDDLIYEISMDGESCMGSEKIKEKFGWEIPKGGQMIDLKRAMEILHVYPDDELVFRQSQTKNEAGKFDDLTIRICKADGTPVWCKISRTVLMDENNQVVSILGKIVDIDRDVKERERLEKKSRTDFLTGLLNKQAFEKEVREYVDTHRMESACFIFIDMDHFKDINDKFGHSVGDQVIKETARKIQLLFKSFDLVGRFGGDEFCVFVKDIPRDTLIDRLRFAVKKMEQEYTYEGGSVKLSASIGAAYCKCNKVSYKELMDVADAAAYQAKDNGRNCYIIRDVE